MGKSPEISEISVEGNKVGICLPSLYQKHETNGGLLAQNHGRKQEACNTTCPVSFECIVRSRALPILFSPYGYFGQAVLYTNLMIIVIIL